MREVIANTEDITLESWLTDYIGHRGGLDDAIDALRVIDGVMKGLLAAWDDDQGLIIVTSDHGNMEDLTGFAEGIVDMLTA